MERSKRSKTSAAVKRKATLENLKKARQSIASRTELHEVPRSPVFHHIFNFIIQIISSLRNPAYLIL